MYEMKRMFFFEYEDKKFDFREREKVLLEKLDRFESQCFYEMKFMVINLRIFQVEMDDLIMEVVFESFDEEENCRLVIIQQKILEVKRCLEDVCQE